MKIRSLLISAITASALVSIAPAQAAPVEVGLRVSVGAYAATAWTCRVAVEAGANGIAVLDAAVAKGCIRSYTTTEFPPYGRFVECINDICQQLGTYWAMYENGSYATVGASFFRAEAGDELGFVYEQWVTCTIPGAC